MQTPVRHLRGSLQMAEGVSPSSLLYVLHAAPSAETKENVHVMTTKL